MTHLRFRGTEYPLGELRLHVDPNGGDWWLIDAERTPEMLFGEACDISELPTTIEVDNRSMDEFLERITGDMQMYWPPGTTPETPLGKIERVRLSVSSDGEGRVRVELDAAMVPEGGEGTHRFELSGSAALVRKPPYE